ncbi:divergent polysaccharide deacetylase family protein [Devosia sp. 1566]|uniref:divergent polysaccharide deacetylase family protein n=1 Tax=Devosia sp. 1566 TaxID=2499144 RepID=UPI0013E29E2A|nr:divergent polysaccharide deacetylase family protein [Devosia sp. 1566]
MANDLSTPLTGRKRRAGAARPGFPVARVLFGVLLLAAGGIGARLLLVDDPEGGRPSREVAITNTRAGNDIASSVSQGPVTITADPEQFAAGAAPPASPTPATAAAPGAAGVLPDLSEETAEGPIPRISATGQTPFQAYARPVDHALVGGKPRIALVVTGLGINEQGSLQAIEQLPDAVTLGFAPYGKTLQSTVAAARAAGHEVLLEIPLEPFDFPQNDPGPHTLLTGETTQSNLDRLFWLMARFGGYAGVLNNMGARFTASGADFAPVVEELGARGLGYLDDGSSNRSLAPQLAGSNKVPFARADLLVDANPAQAAILSALGSLEAKAVENGSAIGIVSALPISVSTIAQWASELESRGVVLVPATALMK